MRTRSENITEDTVILFADIPEAYEAEAKKMNAANSARGNVRTTLHGISSTIFSEEMSQPSRMYSQAEAVS